MKRTRIPRRSKNYARKHKANLKNKRERQQRKGEGKPYLVMPDGREICLDTKAGYAEYDRRRREMAYRQGWICGCGCRRDMVPHQFSQDSVTFQHDAGRGMGGAHRDDRIEIDGKPVNRAYRYECNMREGTPKKSLARVSDVCIIDGHEEVSNISAGTDVEAARKDAS